MEQLCKLDAVAEQRSSGFVERNLRKFSNATSHYGLIDLNGEFIECTSDGRPIANPQNAYNRPEQLATQPARTLHGVRTVVADLLRGSAYSGAGQPDAAAKLQCNLSTIRTFLQQRVENHPNISRKWTLRLRELAEIEAAALNVYLKYHL